MNQNEAARKAMETFTNMRNHNGFRINVNVDLNDGSGRNAAFKDGVVRTRNLKTTTGEGGEGFMRTAKSELFLLASTSMNDRSFYTSKNDRNNRIVELVERIPDPQWILDLVKWLRTDAGMRTSAQVVAVAAAGTYHENNVGGWSRRIIAASIGRLDEVMTVLGLWMDVYGKPIPSAVKRGVADRLVDLTNQYSYLKYRGHTRSRFDGHVVNLRDAVLMTHPKPKDAMQEKLFKVILDEAYGHPADYAGLDTLVARKAFDGLDKDSLVSVLSDSTRATTLIRGAALTPEVISSKLGTVPVAVWNNLIPAMGYKALVMSLRRIREQWENEFGESREVGSFKDSRTYHLIEEKLDKGAGYTPMPIEFLAAYRNSGSEYSNILTNASSRALDKVPHLKGRTLVLVDRSGSMSWQMSMHSTMTRYDVATVFASALALNAEDADVVTFTYTGEPLDRVDFTGVENVLEADSRYQRAYGGTDIGYAVKESYAGHDRVIIITDEQTDSYGTLDSIPDNVPVFIWNVSGERAAMSDSKPGRWTFGGLTDSAFSMIEPLEEGAKGGWPWEK